MIKYAKIIDETQGLCEVAFGDNEEFYKSIGFTLLDVAQSESDSKWYLKDKCPQKTEEEKRAELDSLSLTRADVERAIYKDKGIDFEDILETIKDNPDIDLKALKIELKANNFYRGNPWINQIGSLLGYASGDLDYLFKNGELPIKQDIEDIEPIKDEEN